MEQVILVNEEDIPVGSMEKIEAHQKALLHRAFSVFIFDSHGRMLLQRRADSKYHSPGLWTNACCSHPRPGEETSAAAKRRLREELGFTTELTELFAFTYRSEYDNGLTEYEYDHVLVGHYEAAIDPDVNEVSEYCYRSMEDIRAELKAGPSRFTTWFHLAFPLVDARHKVPTDRD